MTTLQQVELGVLGPLQVRQYGLPVAIPGAKPRALLTMLGLHGGSVVSADALVELLWGADPPRTAAKALQTHISSLRRTLGDGFVLTEGTGWTLSTTEIDATRYKSAARQGRDAIAAGDTGQALARFDEALTLWRGIPELPDGPRGISEKTRWIEGHAALVEDRADALLATGRAAEIIGDLEAAVADAPLRERRWGQLMLALYRAGRQGEALGAYQRVRSLLADELGVDPGPDLRRLEAAIVGQDVALEIPVSQHLSVVTRAVTFLLTDIEGSTAAWEANADAMAVALARHDEIVEQLVTSRGGRLIKTRGEGDATFSVFDRPSAAAAAAIELQEAIRHEPWALSDPMRIRVALHTGEVELRDGDYFGRAVNRAARLRSLAAGGQILCSGATAELVIDSLSDDVILADLGMRQLRNLARPEHVFELRFETAEDVADAVTSDEPMERPGLPAVLAGPGPFVGRGSELERLLAAWQTALAGGMQAVLIAGEPGVGKTRLAGEWSRHAHGQGAVVIYGRCDEDLGAPYQPFAEAMRSLIPCLGAKRLRGLRGVEALLPLVPGLTDVLPDLATPTRADADTERYALFDAVIAVLGVASTSAPVVLILDDLHWAAKPTLLLLRHLLRFGEHARVQIVGTYRSTDLDRSHPLAAMLADLHRDGSATRLQLSGLDEVDVSTYVAEAGYDDEELARALASVTGGNPFFLIEALRHVDESGGRWDPSTLPQGVREAVSRRLSRLPAETNKALAAAAVVGSRFALELVEQVVGDDLVDAFDEACKAGIVIEEPGGRYRFNHAIVRQSLLAELASVRRMRLHQSIAATLETAPGADDELLAELAHHYFECAWAGNAAKAVDYCRRAADQAMARLAYEGAADLYDHAVHALEEIDEELPDRDDQQAELLVARCEALLAAGDVVSAAGAVSQLQAATHDSPRLAAWGTCFDGQLSMLTDPERLDDIESALATAAERLAELDDAAGEAKAHTVRAGCLARLGRIADAETALDQALTAARRAREHRRVNAVLANAPLAALWGPNPVPRAGGRCLDVVRLLRITTGSPVVEATSTRCQAVLDALRGRAAAGRSLLDSARRTLTELGMRHALLEVDQFAGILELVADDPAAAEPHLRRAYNGFRRMGLDADTAETAALLARACLALERNSEADELCTESEHLAGHSLKPSIAWRTVRAQLLARTGAHDEARRMAEEAVAVAERTDLLVDHGDACLALATVLDIAGDIGGARVAAERALSLYELKGAAALAEKARSILGKRDLPTTPAAPEASTVELDNACVQALRRLDSAFDREAWGELGEQVAPAVTVESRRKIVGMPRDELPSDEWVRGARAYPAIGAVRHHHVVVAVRGDRLALTRLEIGTADVSAGAPRDELLQLFGLDDDGRIALQVWFDLDDMDAAIAELDAAHAGIEEPRLEAQRLDNAASRADELLNAYFGARDWDAISELLADDYSGDDRRRVVGAGVRHGRDAAVADARAIADIGVVNMKSTVIATRGQRLFLGRVGLSGPDQRPDAFHAEAFRLVEIEADGRIAAVIFFDPHDLDAAFEELDARYLAGEAAPHAQSWQTLMDTLGELNRHEMGPTLEGIAYVDHRRIPFAPGDFGRAIEDLWALVPDARYRATGVHALDAHGAVISLIIEGTDTDGNELQWARVLSWVFAAARVDVYEADDLDAAIARFEELQPQTRRLENAATKVEERFQAYFAARDWAAMGEILADDISADDRRRVVNAGIRHGRDAKIADMRATADLGTKNGTSTVIAIRGQRLALVRIRLSGRDQRPDAFHTEMLGIVEINADNRMATRVLFDVDDFDAAIKELDARYLAGEATAYAQTWSVVAEAYAGFNQREHSATTPEWVNIDHRRGAAFAPGDMIAYIQAAWDDSPDTEIYIAAVHRLSNLGAVVTHVAHGISQEGFDAEWRDIHILTVEGHLATRSELFDEGDLDAALTKFDELSRPVPPRPENAASQVYQRLWAYFAARDWAALAEIVADDILDEDRRRVVNAGARHGRDALIANLHAIDEVGTESVTSSVVATRGERLALSRVRFSVRRGEVSAEVLNIAEIDVDGRFAASVQFDPDDIDAGFEELDARYLAGEAAPHAHIWSVIAQGYAAASRGELAATAPDVVNIDHRRLAMIESGELVPYLRDTFRELANISTHLEAVHRLTDRGAVVTHVGAATSKEGFDAEWRMINVIVVDGDLISRSETFDEADLDAALVRFEQLGRPAQQLNNAANQVLVHYLSHFPTRDWDAMAQALADDFTADDRRHVVNRGVQHGPDSEIANVKAIAEIGCTEMTTTPIAIRGERLVLSSHSFIAPDWPGLDIEIIDVVEINTENQIVAAIAFDADDLDAAFAELDSRYLAGEAAPYLRTWAVISRSYAAANRQELREMSPDWVNIDHRRVRAFAPGEMSAYMDATWDIAPDVSVYIEAVHRLSHVGVVVTHVAKGNSQQGFEAEWREINLSTVDGDLISRTEMFDEADIDAALARFDELSRQTPRLENAASQVYERFWSYFATRDWDVMAEILGDDPCTEDRRRVVNSGIRHGRDAVLAEISALTEVGLKDVALDVIATRGARLALSRARYSGSDKRPEEAFHSDLLDLVEIDADERVAAIVAFDPADIDAAFEELDARYLAGEGSTHAHTWSLIAEAHVAFNRREHPATPAELIDHRPLVALQTGDPAANIVALWDFTPDLRIHIAAVHRQSDLGAVITQVSHGTSQAGFEAEWRVIHIYTVDGDLVDRCEMFEEADLDAALTRFDELSRPVPRLKNAASQVAERYWTHFEAGDLAAIAGTLTADVSVDDRRRVVNAGIRQGRDDHIEGVRAATDVGFSNVSSAVIATRGAHLVLTRARYSIRDQRPEAFHNEVLHVGETDSEDRFASVVVFDVDDIGAAFEELDARYLTGEAAAHAHTWSVIANAYAALNRHEMYATTPDLVNIDHRRGAMAFAPGDLIEYIHASFKQLPDISFRIEAVHRLSHVGAVYSQVLKGTSQEDFAAEWRIVQIMTVEGELVSGAEIFDETDIDAALARFEELTRPTPRLENAASRAYERLWTYFAARDWDSMAEMLADGICNDDRRRVVNSGIRHGRDAIVTLAQATAGIGATNISSFVIATRGDRLALARARSVGDDQRPDAFRSEVLDVVEIDADERIVARLSFDPNDIEAAFEELDARYIAGEGSAHAQTWSLVTGAFAASKRQELPEVTPDWVNIDHRRAVAFAPGEMAAYMHAMWEQLPDVTAYIEAVHRHTDLGAVVTAAVSGTSQEGFSAEWREIVIYTVESDRISRLELFDDSDVDAALARFDELGRLAPRLENAASQVFQRFQTYFAARDWDAMAETLADGFSEDDRRRVVNAGIRHGRDAEIEGSRAAVDLGITHATSAVIATRAGRVALLRTYYSDRDQRRQNDVLQIVEIDAEERIEANVVFDLDDIDAAYAELDVRYLAGEAAAHAHTWSVIMRVYTALNRHEVSAATPDWVTVDHRPVQRIGTEDVRAYLRATWDVTPDIKFRIEEVHGLSSLGVVVTRVATGTSQEGFDAEWRQIDILTVDGDVLSRVEIFDEVDIDTALARFDELSRPTHELRNAASEAIERFVAYFAARDWSAMAEILAEDMCNDDRRRVVSAGVLRGRNTDIAQMRAIAGVGAKNITSTTIANRGERLVLSRVVFSGEDQGPQAFQAELLGIVEIDTDERIVARVSFDPDDIDAAIEELETRYLTGEAAAHAHTWSVIAGGYAAFNRRELPPIAPDCVNIDHRRGGRAFAPGEWISYIHATWDVAPEVNSYAEFVHRLNTVGAVVSQAVNGTSHDGFDAQWREIAILMVEGDLISRCEMFDEADLDAALARFAELCSQERRLDNAASEVFERFVAYFAAHDWDAMAEVLAEGICNDDRRRVVSAGVLHGRNTDIAHMQAIADVGATTMTSTVIATRGERIVLSRVRISGEDQGPQAFHVEFFAIVEINADERIVARVTFDLDDIDGAFAELDTRYFAGEAAAHAHTWSVVAGVYAKFNRRELPATTTDCVQIDHRPLVTIETADMAANIRAVMDQLPNLSIHIEGVHRLTDLGAVVTHASHGISRDGFDAEWRMVFIYTVDGDLISRFELFDEADIDAALARFDELNRPAQQLENAATRIWAQLADAFNRRDVAAFLALTNPDGHLDDRRTGVRDFQHGPMRQRVVQTLFEYPQSWRLEIEHVASRGSRLCLSRQILRDTDEPDRPITIELLTVLEVGEGKLAYGFVNFDADDIDGAFAELDARYLAGEAAESRTWSVIAEIYAGLNRHEVPATTPDWVNVDHRHVTTMAPGDMTANIRAAWDQTPDFRIYVEAVHRLTDLGAVVTHSLSGTSQEGFHAEWRMVDLVMFEGDLMNRSELFDEDDLDAALARFDELNASAPLLENAAIRTWTQIVDAINRRDADGFLALASADGRLEDRRKGLRAVHVGTERRKAAEAMCRAPASWRMEVEPVAIRGDRLGLTRERWRDTDEAERPVTVESLTLTEVTRDELAHYTVVFDPDDINGAIGELTARWIASGEVAHPEVIESVQRTNEIVSHRDWDAAAKHFAGASYINHRQLAQSGTSTIADWLSSMRTIESLVPDFWVELAEILTCSAIGLVGRMTLNGTSTEGGAIEIPYVLLILVNGDRVTRFEAFDEDQRDIALARFDELNRPA